MAGRLMAQTPPSKGAQKEAMALYLAVTRRDPTRGDAQLGLARAAEANGALKIAERAMRQMIALKPKVSAHRQRLIAFYQRTAQPKKARRAKRDLERVAPKDKRRLRRLKRR